jgi:hypothetical protein
MDSTHLRNEEKALQVTAVAYYAVMLAAFAVGLYGFFSLFWLATAQIQHRLQILPLT